MSTVGNLLLWAVLRDKKVEIFADLRRDLFLKDKQGSGHSELDLYDFIRTHKSTYRQLPDPQTLLQNGFNYDQPPEALEYYQRRLVNRLIRTKTVELHRHMNDTLRTNTGYDKLSEVVDAYRKDINLAQVSNKVKTLDEIAQAFLKDLELSKLVNVRKSVPFGWPTLDKLTGGGMYGGDATYMAARPGRGKTSLAGAVSYKSYQQGFTPLVFSMEVVDTGFAARVIRCGSRV